MKEAEGKPHKTRKGMKMENTTVKNMMDMSTIKYLSAILIIANHRAELSGDMLLGDFLDWLDEKSKTEDYTSQLIEALQKMD